MPWPCDRHAPTPFLTPFPFFAVPVARQTPCLLPHLPAYGHCCCLPFPGPWVGGPCRRKLLPGKGGRDETGGGQGDRDSERGLGGGPGTGLPPHHGMAARRRCSMCPSSVSMSVSLSFSPLPGTSLSLLQYDLVMVVWVGVLLFSSV